MYENWRSIRTHSERSNRDHLSKLREPLSTPLLYISAQFQETGVSLLMKERIVLQKV